MVQILPELNPRRTFGAEFGRSVGEGLSQGGLNAYAQKLDGQKRKSELEKRNEILQQLTGMDFGDLPDDLVKPYLQEQAKSQGKKDFISHLMGGRDKTEQRPFSEKLQNEPSQQEFVHENPESSSQDFQSQINGWYDNLNDSERQQFAAIYPQESKALEAQRGNRIAENIAAQKQKRSEFESERAFHTGYSKEAVKSANVLRESLPKKQAALSLARNAIESGDLSFLSPDKLADSTGIDIFRRAKGAQLITAGKENLLNNMSRVSAKAQNIWFEQRLNSMFPKIGQSLEANLTTQEMLEGEAAMDGSYLNEFDRLQKEDMQKYGFEKKDIEERARNNIKPMEKEIFQRTSYRLKEIEEQEKGLNSLKKSVGKNVVKGTPLTMAMMKLYHDKFGEKALEMAKKNGYYIPTLEEFRTFQIRPEEFREELQA